MRFVTDVPSCRVMARTAGLVSLGVQLSASVLPAQTRADSVAVMRALGDYVRHASAPGPVGLRSGFDSRMMSGVQRRLSLDAMTGPAGDALAGLVRTQAGARVETLPLPRTVVDSVAARRESAYSTVFAFGGLQIGADSAVVTVTRTFNHIPRPSTFTAGEYILTLRRGDGKRWKVATDSLLTISDGFHAFAPIENLPADIREVVRQARSRPPR